MSGTSRLAVGDTAPGFTLTDAHGSSVSLSDYEDSKVIVYFYPAAMTPGCTKEACDFRDNLAELNEAGLDVVGVFTFPGHGYGVGDTRRRAAEQEVAALRTAAESLRAQGIDPRVRSGGSTPTVEFVGDPTYAGVLTEIRPGVYPLNDAQQVEIGTCGFDDVALTAVATVVRSEPGRIVVDAGSKILGADRAAWATGHGRLLDHPDARVVQLSEHHAVVEFPAESTSAPRLGDVIRVVPNHVCTAVNLVDELVAIDGSDSRWPVIARGHNS